LVFNKILGSFCVSKTMKIGKIFWKHIHSLHFTELSGRNFHENFINITFFNNKGYTKKEIVTELVLHGHNSTKKINRKQRNKQQANDELFKHYEEFHDEIIQDSQNNQDDDEDEDEDDYDDEWNISELNTKRIKFKYDLNNLGCFKVRILFYDS
jgi:hypothetical protein